jgi:5'-3' exoribonuclease 2
LVDIYKRLPKDGASESYLHLDGKINLDRLEFLFTELGKVEDKIFVKRQEQVKKDKGAKKKKKMERIKPLKLTGQQQYEHANGKEAEDTSVWMNALVNADIADGEFETTEQKAEVYKIKAKIAKDLSAKPLNLPKWALGPLEGLDPSRLAELEMSNEGDVAITTRTEYSTEAEEWLANKRARNEKIKESQKQWQDPKPPSIGGGGGGSKSGGRSGSSNLPFEAMEVEGVDEEFSFDENGDVIVSGAGAGAPDAAEMETMAATLAPPWASSHEASEAPEVSGGRGVRRGAGAGVGVGDMTHRSALAVAAGIGAPVGEEEEEEEAKEPVDKVRLWEEGWKERYYMVKFQVGATDMEFKPNLIAEYVKGLCWVLEYYFQGVPSWTWYFPYHYAPFASDCVAVQNLDVSFTPGSKPFRPLEQLLAVFPPASAKLLPAAMGNLMVQNTSPIIDNYPLSFETDLNGFKFGWQGVTLLPFVEEATLLEAAATAEPELDKAARRRNTIGNTNLYVSSTHKLCGPMLVLEAESGGASASAGGAAVVTAAADLIAAEQKPSKKSKKTKKQKEKAAAAAAAAAAENAAAVVAAAAAGAGDDDSDAGADATAPVWSKLDHTVSLPLRGRVKTPSAQSKRLVPGQVYVTLPSLIFVGSWFHYHLPSRFNQLLTCPSVCSFNAVADTDHQLAVR